MIRKATISLFRRAEYAHNNVWVSLNNFRLSIPLCFEKVNVYLMFVPCIIGRSRNNRHNSQICTTALFYMLAPTCFGSSLPSSGSFWIRMSYVKIQIDMVVYLKYVTDKNQCVKHLV
jgi:hypothetical protein